jgi:N-acetylglucosaminyldiphosphoundecaprenol N-acetyl-beta-D-mannosaminyltransferase
MTMRSEATRGTDPHCEGQTNPAGSTSALVAPTQQSRQTAQRSGPTVALFGIEIDKLSMADAVAILLRWLDDKLSGCRYVVTPNVNHIVHLPNNPRLRQAYAGASLVIADGWPLVAVSRLFKNALPERVPGSDLVPQLFAAAKPERPLRTFLLGAKPGVAERAAERIKQKWPNVMVVGVHSPPLGFEHDARRCAEILQLVADAAPDLLIIGFGMPKQEIWLHAYRQHLSVKAAIAGGATIDFLAGEQSRAPRWVQRICLEWLYRIGTDPRRLVFRYLRDAGRFPQIVAREWLQLRRNRRRLRGSSAARG